MEIIDEIETQKKKKQKKQQKQRQKNNGDRSCNERGRAK